MNASGFLAAQAEGLFQPAVQAVILLIVFFAFCVFLVLAIGALLGVTAWLTRTPEATPPTLHIVPRSAPGLRVERF